MLRMFQAIHSLENALGIRRDESTTRLENFFVGRFQPVER